MVLYSILNGHVFILFLKITINIMKKILMELLFLPSYFSTSLLFLLIPNFKSACQTGLKLIEMWRSLCGKKFK